jgi:hypothetical protein
VEVEVAGLKAALSEFSGGDGLAVNAAVDAAELAASVRGGSGPLVVVSDGVDGAGLGALASGVRESGRMCIEVRSERWDGQSPSPLSEACRGVISGFGVEAVRQAALVLAAP